MKITALMLTLLFLFSAALSAGAEDYTPDWKEVPTGTMVSRVAVHDPSILAADGKYYIFGTHMTAAVSEDLRRWTMKADGYVPSNKVWGNIFSADAHVFDYAGSRTSVIPTDDGRYHVWAPDVIRNKITGKYMMYYCTSSTWNASNLCFGISDSVEGPYEWQACLICSGFDKNTISATDVAQYADGEWIRKHYLKADGTYNFNDYPNALDPTVFYDAEDRLWMVYGSWSGGIFLLELDPVTGLVLHPEAGKDTDPYFGKRLLGGGHQSIEGPYILYDAKAGWYYLFVSYGSLTAHGGYQIRVFRSSTVDGEYEDMNGKKPGKIGHFKYGLKLSGNYILPSVRTAFMATGHNSAMIDSDGKRYLCYHTRFNNGTESHTPQVKQYGISEEGWPCLLPYTTRRETIPESFDPKDVPGRYDVISQGTLINDKIAEPFILYLREDGTIGGENTSGSWQLTENSVYLHVTLDGNAYSGILCRMQDEAEAEVTVFSVVGNNESIWGVKYSR
ncbi:MAG: glycoside hydrolase family 43 protein [Clostridia bacterium]|nr:glycoside hydrolase family 43 protein [Clostridia bacterium]